MARKSSSALSVITPKLDRRPDPPAKLTPAEAELWKAIVATKPVDWFKADCIEILANLCRSSVRLDQLSEVINDMGIPSPHDREMLTAYKDFMNLARQEALILSQLATKLRLTPQARYTTQSAATADRKAAVAKPWEI